MRKLIFTTLLVCVAALVAGCSQEFKQALEDGYQFGDFTAAQQRNLDKYCSEEYAMARTAIRSTASAATETEQLVNVCDAYEEWQKQAEESAH